MTEKTPSDVHCNPEEITTKMDEGRLVVNQNPVPAMLAINAAVKFLMLPQAKRQRLNELADLFAAADRNSKEWQEIVDIAAEVLS